MKNKMYIGISALLLALFMTATLFPIFAVSAETNGADVVVDGASLVYTVTFLYENGDVFVKITYDANDARIIEPAVPYKKGYVGQWETYTLNGNVTVRPVYTREEGPNETEPQEEGAAKAVIKELMSGCSSSVGLLPVLTPAMLAVAVLLVKRKE